MIDYKKLAEEAEKTRITALEMFLDPKTKMTAIADIYKMLEVSEMIGEMVSDSKQASNEEIKDELHSGEEKYEHYEKTHDMRWLKAADTEADHAALYMEMYNDYSMKDWHNTLKAKIKKAAEVA